MARTATPAKRKALEVPLDIDNGVQPFRVPKTAELLARDLRNRIVRGEAGERQVESAKVGLQHNVGIGGACVVSVLRR